MAKTLDLIASLEYLEGRRSLNSKHPSELGATTGSAHRDTRRTGNLALDLRDAESSLPRERESWTEFHMLSLYAYPNHKDAFVHPVRADIARLAARHCSAM